MKVIKMTTFHEELRRLLLHSDKKYVLAYLRGKKFYDEDLDYLDKSHLEALLALRKAGYIAHLNNYHNSKGGFLITSTALQLLV